MSDEADIGAMLEQAIGNAIEQAVRDLEPGFVTRWVAVVESVDGEGARGVWMTTSDDAKAWDTMGLLRYAITVEDAGVLRRAVGDE